MAPRTQRDLTNGPLAGHVVALAVPAILSTLVHNLYGLNDVFFAKHTGLVGQTAVSNNLFVMITIFGFIQLASIGTLTLVSRRTGAGNEDGADRAARQGLWFALALSLVIAAIGEVSAPWVGRLMRMEPAVAAASTTYLRVLFLGMPFLFLFPTIESIFRARGDARTPLLLQVIAVGTNIAGNALAVLVLDLGVAGIAAATILSRLVASAVGFLWLKRGRVGLPLRRHEGSQSNLALWRRIASVSAPVGLRTMLFGLIYQVVSRITGEVARASGELTSAAQNGLGVGIRVEGMFFFILVGFGLAAGPLVGQNLGAGQPERARRAAWITVLMALVPAAVFTTVFLIDPGPFMRLFAADAATVVHGTDYLRIVAVSFLFLALEVVLANAFVGAGDTVPPMLVDVPLTALRIPLSLMLATGLGLGVHGVWWAISLTAVARGIGMSALFLRGRWQRARPDLDH